MKNWNLDYTNCDQLYATLISGQGYILSKINHVIGTCSLLTEIIKHKALCHGYYACKVLECANVHDCIKLPN